LLAEEIELRRHIERVAEQRRALPAGGEVKKLYAFDGESGPVTFAELFGDKQTLAVYSFMYGPQRKQPCPMCTSLLSAWDGEIKHIEQRIALVAVARSPLQRLVALKKERGWRDLKVCSDGSGDYTRDYVSAADADVPGFSIFTRKSGSIHHLSAAQFPLEPSEVKREAKSILMGGGMVAGAASGATVGVVVAGPVGVVVGSAVGAVVGVLGAAAAGSIVNPAGSSGADTAMHKALT
jgi:predicted dithiol-disulfide oxidoreductase (DUF899 family)